MNLNRRALGGGLLASLALSVKRAFGAGRASGSIIAFQGRLTDANGVTVPDGAHTVAVTLYENGAPTGFTETIQVVTKDGVFSTFLGETAPLPRFHPANEYAAGLSVDGQAELQPRQHLGTVPVAQVATYGAVPVGGILNYWGNSAALPPGYELCDGSQVTTAGSPLLGQTKPNLTDKFVRGATGDVKTAAVTGGTDTIDLKHTHTTGSCTLTANEIPSHTHTDNGHSHSASIQMKSKSTPGSTYSEVAGGTDGGGSWAVWNVQVNTGKASLTAAGGGKPHNHGNTGDGLFSPQSLLPAYVGLLYIMRVV